MVERIAISLPSELLETFDELMKRKAYTNRSKAIADVLRWYLASSEWEDEKKGGKGKQRLGTITILYDHHSRGVLERLTEIQHAHGSAIASSMHVHVGEDCLEVVVAKGAAREIDGLANRLISARGVKLGRLVISR